MKKAPDTMHLVNLVKFSLMMAAAMLACVTHSTKLLTRLPLGFVFIFVQ